MLNYNKIKVTKLANGLNFIGVNDDSSHSLMVGFYVPYGSNMLTFHSDKTNFKPGIAHFLEHRIFDTRKGDAATLLSQIGCSANAYTSYNETVYFFQGDQLNYLEGMKILLDFTSILDFEEDHVEREKGIILSELSMNQDDNDQQCYLNLMRNLYDEKTLQYDILGTKEDITSVTYQDLKDAFETFYKTDQCYLIIVGNYDEKEVKKIALQYKKRISKYKLSHDKIAENYEKVNKLKSSFIGDVSRPIIYYGIKLNRKELEKRFDSGTLFFLLRTYIEANFLQCSKFYEKMKNDNLLDQSFNAYVDYAGESMTLIFTLESDNFIEVKKKIDENLIAKDLDEETFLNVINGIKGSLLQISSIEDIFYRICNSLSLCIDQFALAHQKMNISYSMMRELTDIINNAPRSYSVARKK